jgi:hypothetical protein
VTNYLLAVTEALAKVTMRPPKLSQGGLFFVQTLSCRVYLVLDTSPMYRSISFIPFINEFDFMRPGSTASAEALAKADFSFKFDFLPLGSTKVGFPNFFNTVRPLLSRKSRFSCRSLYFAELHSLEFHRIVDSKLHTHFRLRHPF